MGKRQNNITRQWNGSNYYYTFRMPPDALGKRKRLYAKTVEELKVKIKKAEEENNQIMNAFKPNSKRLSDYITFYFRHAATELILSKFEPLKHLFERTILNKEIDKDIDTLTTEDLNSYYHQLSESYSTENIKDINSLIENTLAIAAQNNIPNNVDFSQIVIPAHGSGTKEYIPSPEELEILLEYCINDGQATYGTNELLIAAIMLTGLPAVSLKDLRSKDIDTEQGVLTINNVKYPLSDEAKQWFAELTNEHKRTGKEYVFGTSNDKPPMRQRIWETVKGIAKRCGLPQNITGRTLQKAYVISELQKGTTKKVLMERLGYKSIYAIMVIQKQYELSRYNPVALGEQRPAVRSDATATTSVSSPPKDKPE